MLIKLIDFLNNNKFKSYDFSSIYYEVYNKEHSSHLRIYLLQLIKLGYVESFVSLKIRMYRCIRRIPYRSSSNMSRLIETESDIGRTLRFLKEAEEGEF